MTTRTEDAAGTTRGPVRSILAVALGAGVLGAIQPKLNAVLGDRVGSALVAALINFLAAFVAVVLLLAFRPGTRRHLREVRSWPVPWWAYSAGLCGVLIVLAGASTVETIGVAIFSVAFFAGQITSGLVVDRLGIGSGARRRLTPARVQAAVLAVVAVVVAQVGRPVGSFAPLLVALVVLAGASSAFQAACNGRIAGAIGDPLAPTALNITLGSAALLAIVATVAATGGIDRFAWPREPWLYLGGTLGVAIVLALAISANAVGVLRTTVAMLAAQLVGAFTVDWVVAGRAPTPGSLVGAALVFAAVVRLGRARSTSS